MSESTVPSSSSAELHIHFLRLALEEAKKCIPTRTAFCVGCVITVQWPSEHTSPIVLATGYSRELPGNTHAEANALSKACSLTREDLAHLFPHADTSQLNVNSLLARAEVYTTMEPCSIRTSGLSPCSDALISTNIKRCFIGVGEPDDFVVCEGAQRLKDSGIDVQWIKGLEDDCIDVARRGH
ncbi:cytidine deaminase-like protein [Cyathus striatus]|nr:cytidine deaminase-like protein [Cyathus striatus]